MKQIIKLTSEEAAEIKLRFSSYFESLPESVREKITLFESTKRAGVKCVWIEHFDCDYYLCEWFSDSDEVQHA